MPERDRLTEASDWIELGFLEREATPEPAMKLGIQMHLAGLSLADTVRLLDCLGVDRHRATVHRWVKRPTYSPPAVQRRITSRSTRR